MIGLRPYEDLAAWQVLRALDGADLVEAALVRGAGVTPLQLFAEWRAMEPHRVLSVVALRGERPFAVVGLVSTGQAGVAQAAMLARDHAAHARALARLVLAVRDGMPRFCAERGIRRIEARCWERHPTAARMLARMGFALEARMEGFGGPDPAVFLQFAYVADPASAPAPASPKE